MKTYFKIFLALLGFSALVSEATFILKVDESKINWKGYKVTGSHDGLVSFKGGRLVFDEAGNIKEGVFEANLETIKVLDLKDPSQNAKLTNHLKDDDFFGVSKFPIAKLIVKSGQKLAEGEYKIQGDMEIKGITQPVEFVAKINKEDRILKGKANLKLDRTKWDIKYNSGKFFKNLGDKLIYDDFEVEVEVVAEKA